MSLNKTRDESSLVVNGDVGDVGEQDKKVGNCLYLELLGYQPPLQIISNDLFVYGMFQSEFIPQLIEPHFDTNTSYSYDVNSAYDFAPMANSSSNMYLQLPEEVVVSKQFNLDQAQEPSSSSSSSSSSSTSTSTSTSKPLSSDNFINPQWSQPLSFTKSTKLQRPRRACQACQTRKLKCDRSKPLCSQCKSNGTKCVYKLFAQFKEDVESQGKRFGREGINSINKITTDEFVLRSKHSHYQPIRHQGNLQFVNVFNDDITKTLHKPILFPALQTSIIPSDVLSSSHQDSSMLDFAIKYYVEFISPILNPCGYDTIQYKRIPSNKGKEVKHMTIERGLDLGLLVKLSQSNHCLFYLMLALGSFYLSKNVDTDQDQMWEERAFEFHRMGLVKLNPILISLSKNETLNDEISIVDTLVALTLLILFEMVNNCNPRWIVYLRLTKRVLTLVDFKIPTDVDIDNNKPDQETNQISLVSWMGCDRGLIQVISDITDLSFERFKKTVTEKEYLQKCNQLKQMLEEMNIHMMDFYFSSSNGEPHSVSDQFMGFEEEEFYLLLSYEIKRITTELYLNCCLLNMGPEDESVGKLVREIFKLLEIVILQHDYKWYSTLIWCIFVAASEISVLSPSCDEMRFSTLKLLAKLETNTLGNIKRTREIILGVWKKRDLDNSDLHSMGMINIHHRKFRKRKKLLGFENDWEKYIVDKGHGIALA
ncbi:hypothetical protein KGF56_001418 [Candida oxycetoniae]|uniref:Zn(2)-C6 fungal-type domain-containing protein n=1 Tax=Candida oxycetoniae TaxID=497107 RepID=A0AAI9SZ30_9ASCO|nr:uncharacterized protein KGF56_001418 [Candida oxycetoniae]KAI3405811.2 hypothetical protein KGF56_001418 [Candida oxycetoniae]